MECYNRRLQNKQEEIAMNSQSKSLMLVILKIPMFFRVKKDGYAIGTDMWKAENMTIPF